MKETVKTTARDAKEYRFHSNVNSAANDLADRLPGRSHRDDAVVLALYHFRDSLLSEYDGSNGIGPHVDDLVNGLERRSKISHATWKLASKLAEELPRIPDSGREKAIALAVHDHGDDLADLYGDDADAVRSDAEAIRERVVEWYGYQRKKRQNPPSPLIKESAIREPPELWEIGDVTKEVDSE